MKVKVNVAVTIEFPGNEEEYIRIAEKLEPGGLDSRDIGDATGTFVNAALQSPYEPSSWSDGKNTVVATPEVGLFKWDRATKKRDDPYGEKSVNDPAVPKCWA